MAYRKYNLNGREMLNLDNHGMVDYDEYYTISNRSYERKKDITDKYIAIQSANMFENEPSINYSALYSHFLEELKSVNPEIYNKKMTFYRDYLKELNEEENMYSKEKQQLLSKGYLFDKKLKMYGYYIIEIDNNYYQYKLVEEKNVKIDMGDKLISQNANISNYELVPITLEDLQEIKSQGLFEESITRKHR